MREEQNDPAADEHGAEHAEERRGLHPAAALRFAIALRAAFARPRS